MLAPSVGSLLQKIVKGLDTNGYTLTKNHACTICGKTFTQNSSRLSHDRKHVREKPHPCFFCEKAFANKTDKVKHESTSHCQRMHQKQIDDKQENFFRIAKSEIEGYSVVAAIAIPKGINILEYFGERITRTEADVAEAKYQEEKIKKTYLFEVTKEDLVIDATKTPRMARLINHVYEDDCEGDSGPNCAVNVIEKNSKKRIIIGTIRDIAKGQPPIFGPKEDILKLIGDELTIDYKMRREKGKNRIRCKCPSKNCRGFLNWSLGCVYDPFPHILIPL